MNNGGDAAEQVVRLSLEGFEVAAKLTGSAAKNVAALLISVLKQENHSKTKGKERLTKMIKSGKELKVYSVPNKDLKKFVAEAKRYGVLYCVLKDRGSKGDNTPIDIIARAEDASKIQRIFDKFKLASVDSTSIVTETEKDVKARKGTEKGRQKRAKADIIADEALKKPKQKDGYANENPDAAKTEKSPPSRLKSDKTNKAIVTPHSDKGTADKKPSVREKLNRYSADIKQQKEQKAPERTQDKPAKNGQTKHKLPKRNDKRKKVKTQNKSKER